MSNTEEKLIIFRIRYIYLGENYTKAKIYIKGIIFKKCLLIIVDLEKLLKINNLIKI